MTQEHAAIGHH